MPILKSLDGLDTKFYELWRFSNKGNVSHIKFGQCLYTLIQLIHEDPSLKEILPLEELLSLSIYHLKELIFKKNNEGLELLPAFHTVYLESVCHVCPPQADEHLEHSVHRQESHRKEVDNYELIDRINQNENLARSAEEFSKFCKQKRFSIFKDSHKKPFVNPIYNQIKKEIDDYTYNNERLLLFIGNFPKINGQRDRRGRVQHNINLSSSDLIKNELLKITREGSTQNMKIKFIKEYKKVLKNKLTTSIEKIKELQNEIGPMICGEDQEYLKCVVNNNEPVYNDSINTLQLTEDTESIEFSILEFAVVEDKDLYCYKDRSQTTEDVSDTGLTSNRSYLMSNRMSERTEHSFGFASINELFQIDYEMGEGFGDRIEVVHFTERSRSEGLVEIDREMPTNLTERAGSDQGYVQCDVDIEFSDRGFSEDEDETENKTALCTDVEDTSDGTRTFEYNEVETIFDSHSGDDTETGNDENNVANNDDDAEVNVAENEDSLNIERLEIGENEQIDDDIINFKYRRGIRIQIESATTCSMDEFVMIDDNYRLEEELYQKETCCFGLFNKLKFNKWGSRRH